MKDDQTAEAPIFAEVRAALGVIEVHRNNSFSDLAAALSLDPKKAFRNADLAHVDFSNANLSGFNFTGADLRGAFGVNVRIDETTVFEAADLADSIFAFDAKVRDYFRDKDVEREYWLLKNGHWADSIVKVGNHLIGRTSSAEKYAMMAQRLFFDTKDMVVKNNMLFALYGRGHDLFGFIMKVLSTPNIDETLIPPILTIMAAVYYNKREAFDTAMRYVHSDHEHTNGIALRCTIRSKFNWSNRDEIVDIVKQNWTDPLRRGVVGKVARQRGRLHLDAVTEPNSEHFLDYKETITAAKLLEIARRNVDARNTGLKVQELWGGIKYERDLKKYDADVRAEVADVRQRLVDLRDDGLPFVFETPRAGMIGAAKAAEEIAN